MTENSPLVNIKVLRFSRIIQYSTFCPLNAIPSMSIKLYISHSHLARSTLFNFDAVII